MTTVKNREDNAGSHIAIFKGKEIRNTLHNNEWWFAIADGVEVLTDTANSTDYIKKMRNRYAWRKAKSLLCQPRRDFPHFPAYLFAQGRAFQVLAGKVGYERVQEIEDPELAAKMPVCFVEKENEP